MYRDFGHKYGPKLDHVNDTTGRVDSEISENTKRKPIASKPARAALIFLQRHGRRILYSYTVVLLLVMSFQAVSILLILRQSQGWVQYWLSFGRDFATSPAAAGICAVIAAWLGASQLSRQLNHSKKKAAEEAWWQQFEWVTDRIISSRSKTEKDDTRLPSSLAFDLMTALSRSATESFQETAVAGVLNHYLKEVRKPQASASDQEEAPPSNGPNLNATGSSIIDSEGAEALRTLIDELPLSSRARARTVLRAYEDEYEQDVVKALRHRFGDAFQAVDQADLGVDATIEIGSQRIAVEVRQSVRDLQTLDLIAQRMQRAMGIANASKGVVITTPTPLNHAAFGKLSQNEVHLIEWEPSMGSSALNSSVRSVLRGGVL